MSKFVFLILFLAQSAVLGQILFFGKCPNPPPMEKIDLEKLFHGRWYDIERYWVFFEAVSECLSEEYFPPNPNKTTYDTEITVTLAGRRIVVPASKTFNERVDGNAIADVVTPGPIKYKMRLPFLILDTDYQTYLLKWGCRQIGPLNIQLLWLLSRDKTFSEETRRRVYEILANKGLNTQKLRKSDNSNCPI